jgi:hypothetical protein
VLWLAVDDAVQGLQSAVRIYRLDEEAGTIRLIDPKVDGNFWRTHLVSLLRVNTDAASSIQYLRKESVAKTYPAKFSPTNPLFASTAEREGFE